MKNIDLQFVAFVGMEHLLRLLAHSNDINTIRVVKSLLRGEAIAEGSFHATEAALNHMLLLYSNRWDPVPDLGKIETYRRIVAYARENVHHPRKRKNPKAPIPT